MAGLKGKFSESAREPWPVSNRKDVNDDATAAAALFFRCFIFASAIIKHKCKHKGNEMRVFMLSADSFSASFAALLEDDSCVSKGWRGKHKSISLLCEELLCASFMLFAIAFGYVQNGLLRTNSARWVLRLWDPFARLCKFTLYGGGVWRLQLMTLGLNKTPVLRKLSSFGEKKLRAGLKLCFVSFTSSSWNKFEGKYCHRQWDGRLRHIKWSRVRLIEAKVSKLQRWQRKFSRHSSMFATIWDCTRQYNKHESCCSSWVTHPALWALLKSQSSEESNICLCFDTSKCALSSSACLVWSAISWNMFGET